MPGMIDNHLSPDPEIERKYNIAVVIGWLTLVVRGEKTREDMIAALNLDVDEEATVDTMIARAKHAALLDPVMGVTRFVSDAQRWIGAVEADRDATLGPRTEAAVLKQLDAWGWTER